MKRSAALADLSREHHTALVWAKRAQASDLRDPQALMASLVGVFAAEIEPHFRREEDKLLEALAQVGLHALVERTLADHAELRAAIERIRAGDTQALAAFGATLAAHVRFEERELFPAAEAALPADMLAAIVRAS